MPVFVAVRTAVLLTAFIVMKGQIPRDFRGTIFRITIISFPPSADLLQA